MGKPSPPEAPDYSEIAAASEASAQLSYQTAQDQLAWAQEQYDANLELMQPVIDSYMETINFANATAEADRARYEEQFQPLEDQLIAEAESYASPERMALEMGKAQGTVAQQYDQARESAQQQLEGYGLNPADTRYAAMDIGTRTDQATAAAAAGNQAYAQTQATADALRGEAINIGKGYPAQAVGEAALGTQTGQAAMSGTTGQMQTGSNMMTAPSSYMQTGNAALDVWGNTITDSYNAQMSQYNAQMAAASGVGQAVGTVMGFAMPYMPVPHYQTGGQVPPQASPSAGARPDDVPAMVSAGEFVVPDDVVRWKGSEYFYKEIEKSRQKKAETMGGAVPAGPPAAGAGARGAPPSPRPPAPTGGNPMPRPMMPGPGMAPRAAPAVPAGLAAARPMARPPGYAGGGYVAPQPLYLANGGYVSGGGASGSWGAPPAADAGTPYDYAQWIAAGGQLDEYGRPIITPQQPEVPAPVARSAAPVDPRASGFGAGFSAAAPPPPTRPVSGYGSSFSPRGFAPTPPPVAAPPPTMPVRAHGTGLAQTPSGFGAGLSIGAAPGPSGASAFMPRTGPPPVQQPYQPAMGAAPPPMQQPYTPAMGAPPPPIPPPFSRTGMGPTGSTARVPQARPSQAPRARPSSATGTSKSKSASKSSKGKSKNTKRERITEDADSAFEFARQGQAYLRNKRRAKQGALPVAVTAQPQGLRDLARRR